jgi:hypothetical protein
VCEQLGIEAVGNEFESGRERTVALGKCLRRYDQEVAAADKSVHRRFVVNCARVPFSGIGSEVVDEIEHDAVVRDQVESLVIARVVDPQDRAA